MSAATCRHGYAEPLERDPEGVIVYECYDCGATFTHSAIMTGAGTAPLCSCGWQGKPHEGPILADHLREANA